MASIISAGRSGGGLVCVEAGLVTMQGSGGIGDVAGISSLGDDKLDCIGRVSSSSRGCRARSARSQIGSNGGVRIFSYLRIRMGNVPIVRT